jgi:hypothetical protein
VKTRGAAWLVAAIAAALVLLGAPPLASAEERPVVFSLTMAPSPLDRCGGAPALTASVDERLHRSVFVSEDEADIAFAIASDDGTNHEWHARIVERDRTGAELGRRDVPLPSDDCNKALDTLAVVLAIMIGPRTTTEPPRHAPSAEPAPEPPSAPPPPLAPPKTKPLPRPAPPPPRWHAGALAGVTSGTGILPGLAWGLQAGVVVAPPVARLSAIVRGEYWPARTTGTVPPADVDRLGVAALGCYQLFRTPSVRDSLGLSACSGLDVSRIQARSGNLTRPSEASVLVGLLGELRLGYRFAPSENLYVEPGIAVQITGVVRRDRFTYRDLSGRERTLLEPASFAFESGFGVAVHFL